MIVVTLGLKDRNRAAPLMEGHNAWIRQGFEDGVFMLVGSLPAGGGGVILAHGVSPQDMEERLRADPFVSEGVVSVDLLAVTPGRTDERLDFLKA